MARTRYPVSPDRPAALRERVSLSSSFAASPENAKPEEAKREPGPELALATLMAALTEKDVRWWFDGTALILSAPPGVLNKPLERAIDEHLGGLARYAERVAVTLQACATCGGNQFWEWVDEPGAKCVRCAPRETADQAGRPERVYRQERKTA